MYSCELYPTVITPFGDDLKVDYEALDRLIDLFVLNDVDGLFAVCQSSEMFFLSDDEKLELAAFCIDKCRRAGIRCVVSGHTQDTPDEQIAYLKRLEQLKPDAIIMINNRFAAQDEDESVCVQNMKYVISALKPETRLGVYECPYPYKRIISMELIDAMLEDGRFDFVKDTCCQFEMIKQRVDRLKGSCTRLFNANGATLYESLIYGAAGYSGVMLNMVPEAFAVLKHSINADAKLAARAGQLLSALSTIEWQNYPANAKYLQVRRGIFRNTLVRNGKPPLTESQTKEMEAFEAMYSQLLTSLMPHAHAVDMFTPGYFFRNCHASCVTALDNGDVLCVYFAGSRESCDDTGIWMSRRSSGVWLAPERIAKVNETAHWNPVIIKTPEGLLVTFRTSNRISTWQTWHIESFDDGETWTEPRAYGGNLGPVRSKPIVLNDGRLLAPNSDETDDRWTARVDVSDDWGESFRKLADIPLNTDRPGDKNYMSGKGAIQPTLWQSDDGSIHALLRTTCGYIFRSDSTDGGNTWCEAYNTGLPNNNSGIDVCSAGGALWLIMNPVCGNWAARSPLTLYKSTDGGKSFIPVMVCADMPGGEFSYPSLYALDERLHVSFTDRRRSISYCCFDIASELAQPTIDAKPVPVVL